MKRAKDTRARQHIRWGLGLLIFALINLCLRLMLLPINQAEYTDGIIQVTQFGQLTGIYPPLYTALCWPLGLIMPPHWAGRVISTLFSAAGVIPLYLMARRSFGMRAAVFTGVVYTVAPVALRWSPRVMTDATFAFFFWFACERLLAAQGSRTREDVDRCLMVTCILGAAAALTRYQGLMLLPPVLLLAWHHWRVRGIIAWRGVSWSLLFALPFVWSWYAGNIHGEQFLERTRALGPMMTFIITAEPFVLLIPYFLTYPVAIMALLGIYVGNGRKKYALTPISIYVFVVLIIVQSLFSSFQERYLLPVFGFLYIWAGLGLAVIDDRCRRKFPRWRPYAPIVVAVSSLFVAVLVLLGGRQAFGDVARASHEAGAMVRNAPEARIHTTEQYRQGIYGIKVAYYSRQPVRYLDAQKLGASIGEINPGDVLVLSSRDDLLAMAGQVGGWPTLLSRYFELEEVARHHSVLTPVFPDLMQNRSIEQSPVAWLYRYQPQNFDTVVLRVVARKGG